VIHTNYESGDKIVAADYYDAVQEIKNKIHREVAKEQCMWKISAREGIEKSHVQWITSTCIPHSEDAVAEIEIILLYTVRTWE
jgi:hypothetical protein